MAAGTLPSGTMPKGSVVIPDRDRGARGRTPSTQARDYFLART